MLTDFLVLGGRKRIEHPGLPVLRRVRVLLSFLLHLRLFSSLENGDAHCPMCSQVVHNGDFRETLLRRCTVNLAWLIFECLRRAGDFLPF